MEFLLYGSLESYKEDHIQILDLFFLEAALTESDWKSGDESMQWLFR